MIFHFFRKEAYWNLRIFCYRVVVAWDSSSGLWNLTFYHYGDFRSLRLDLFLVSHSRAKGLSLKTRRFGKIYPTIKSRNYDLLVDLR